MDRFIQLPDKFWLIAVFLLVLLSYYLTPSEFWERAVWLTLGSLLAVLRSNSTTQNINVTDQETLNHLMFKARD